MPVVRINDDGTVRIARKSGAGQMDVSPDDLPKYSPTLFGEYQKKLQEQETLTNAIKAVSSGSLQVGDLPAEQRIGVVSGIQKQGATIPPSKDKKKDDSLNAINNLIGNLERHYQEAGGGEVSVPILANILGLKKDAEGALGFNDAAKTYNAEKAGFAATLKSLTGDTGVLTDQDFSRLAQLLPALGAKPQVAKNLLNDLRSQVAARYGGEAQQTSIKPKEKNALQAILPSAYNAAQDIGTGIRAITQLPTLNRQIQTSEAMSQIAQQARDRGDTQTEKQLLGKSSRLANEAQGASKEIQNSYTEDVNINPALRGILPALEITSAAEVPGMAIGAKKLASGGLKAVLGKSGASTAREQAVANSSKLIEGDKVANHFTDWAQRAYKSQPGKEKQINKIVDSVINSYGGKKITPQEAFKIWLDSSNGYKADGTIKTALESDVDRQMREVLRPLLEESVPGFDELTKTMAKNIQARKVLGKAGSIAGGGAVAGLTAIGLNKILGQK